MLVMGSGCLHRALSAPARRVQRRVCVFGMLAFMVLEVDEWINGGVLRVMIDCFLVLWWTSGVAASVWGRVGECGLSRPAVDGA